MKRIFRCAVIGVGHFGKLHAQKYASLSNCTLVAVADIDASAARRTAARYSCLATADYRDLYGQVDLVSVVTSTDMHFAIASDFLCRGVHVLVEKPMTANLSEADKLIEVARQHDSILQVGHIERFNPAIQILNGTEIKGGFIRSSRLTPASGKSTNKVSAVLDLMIHDLDLVLSVVPAAITRISAKGIGVFTPEADIVNARLEFGDSSVADLSVSRISSNKEMKFQVFTRNRYISIDLMRQHYKHFRRGKKPREFIHEQRSFIQTDALMDEIRHFVECVRTGATPLVDGSKARQALAAAIQINTALKQSFQLPG